MMRLIKMPAPTMNADLAVLSFSLRSTPGARGKAPVASPTTSTVSPAISEALLRVSRPSEFELTRDGASELPPEDFASGTCDLGPESCSSFISSWLKFRVQPLGCGDRPKINLEL